MKIYEVSCDKNTKKLTLISGILLIGASVLMLLTLIFGDAIPFRWAIQLISIGMYTAMIFIMTRYVSRSYVYAVEERDGELDLTVTEVQGKGSVTVCRVSLSGIEECVDLSEKKTYAAEKIKREGRKKFDYRTNPVGDRLICVFCEECGECLAITLTYDRGLCEYLKAQKQ